MAGQAEQIINIPNTVSAIRILMAPVLIVLALHHQPDWYIAVLIFAEFTDVLDGFLARKLNQITTMGSHLDSWGDFIIYSTLAVCAWLLWPDILLRELLWFLAIVASFTLPVLIGFIKYRRFTGYHTWSVKAAVAVSVTGYVLLFTGLLDWPFRVGAVLCLYAAAEEIAITLLSREEHVDVRSFPHALRSVRRDRD